ncbi:hypothetical protein A359_07660 [secondary endosymbiont of Ctenarytaina eucalypti]|uniref:Uncharacterized protein n=1 Tax=secondary endosymbiont of Ctenarytaina eucalypti TaxID=1199245 RepID=J3TXW4_9ENTR|nr:hypothetical protein A359_07660 [secondary endosymbiont of Ctenarytaina eucalypti]
MVSAVPGEDLFMFLSSLLKHVCSCSFHESKKFKNSLVDYEKYSAYFQVVLRYLLGIFLLINTDDVITRRQKETD